jgi:heterodisulfide reductase subunit B
LISHNESISLSKGGAKDRGFVFMVNVKNVGQEIQKLKAQKESLEQLITVGDLYIQQGNKLEARQYYQDAIKKYPKKADGYIRMGTLALLNESYDEADDNFQQAIDVDKNCIPAWIGLTKIFLKKQGITRAHEMIDRALKVDPNHSEAVFLGGLVKLRAGDYFHAQQLLTQASTTETSPFMPYAKFYLGILYAHQGWFQKAKIQFLGLKTHTAFNDLNSQNGIALRNNLALVELRLNNFTEAESWITMVTKAAKNVPASIWMNLAIIYWSQDKIPDAITAIKKANELDSKVFPWMKELEEYMQTGSKGLKDKIQGLLKENPKGYNVGLYLGCIIPNRYPFIEAASRHFLNEFAIGVKDLEGASCCPAPGVFRSFDIDTWLAIGSRNVVLSEQLNRDLVTMCNGCYGTLNDINSELKHDPKKKAQVNEHLKKIGKEFKGNIKVRHIMDVIINTIGMEELEKRITNKLNLRVAVHYGCHLLKPAKNKPWQESFENPEFFDKLIELTGCKSVPYKDKMMCCGAGGAVRTGAKEVSLDFTREKLVNMRDAGIDAIILCCPFCHLQFDLGQNETNQTFAGEIGEPFHIPVIYITQLLGLAIGLDPFRLGLLRTPKPKGVPPYQPVEPIFATYQEEIKWE